jgi:membrane fusion protein (multidrug efflux system)
MEYLTLLNYLYVVTTNSRKRAAKTVTFFLSHRLTVLNNLVKLKHRTSIHHTNTIHNSYASIKN